MIRVVPLYCSKCKTIFGEKYPVSLLDIDCPNCGSEHVEQAELKSN